MSYAFRCKNCNALEAAGAAGEREVPAACHQCGYGVHFDPVTGIKGYDTDNWIVLASLSPEKLKPILDFHKFEAKEIEKHVPFKEGQNR